MNKMLEHEHPLNLIDLWSHNEEESDEEEDEDKDENDDLNTQQDFKCRCDRCEEEINWFHRYLYKCDHCPHFSIHKFCGDLPATLEHPSHSSHTLTLTTQSYFSTWECNICDSGHRRPTLYYRCSDCFFFHVDLKCATSWLKTDTIHHPSHKHPLVRNVKSIICECDACGKKHEGFFYQCVTCPYPLIHADCAFLSNKMLIQQATNDIFTHSHPLTLSYSFTTAEQQAKNNPKCRVCVRSFYNKQKNRWIYKCDKCRYYAHIDCATSRGEPFMSIFESPGTGKLLKNYEDDEHPNLVHLPFPDESYSLLKTLFFKEESGSSLETKKLHVSHQQHPLILILADHHLKSPTSCSKIKNLSYHNPMKKIQLLCNGCVRPITDSPFYTCDGEDETFVLHEWCTRLPADVKDHPCDPQHTLVFFPSVPDMFFGVFECSVCGLPCNGFVYSCVECGYHVDVNCAFIPKEITHKAHPNHLLSLIRPTPHQTSVYRNCRMCLNRIYPWEFSFGCETCDVHLHVRCGLFVNETISHTYDKHPLKLRYFPVENHKSDYFCEICEEELNPEVSFYHCDEDECVQSIHPACAPSILQSETHMGYYASSGWQREMVYRYLNIKFGGILYYKKNEKNVHPHPLSFAQGIATDGTCANNKCGYDRLQYEMIFKCEQCKYAIHYGCLL